MRSPPRAITAWKNYSLTCGSAKRSPAIEWSTFKRNAKDSELTRELYEQRDKRTEIITPLLHHSITPSFHL